MYMYLTQFSSFSGTIADTERDIKTTRDIITTRNYEKTHWKHIQEREKHIRDLEASRLERSGIYLFLFLYQSTCLYHSICTPFLFFIYMSVFTNPSSVLFKTKRNHFFSVLMIFYNFIVYLQWEGFPERLDIHVCIYHYSIVSVVIDI